ncbi:MAG: methyltransferase domain-containing protein [Thermoanaerobaculia bacterium]|nr:methyltransferase domain-containing protein [Thermoanaerobaculia bacterium]
MIRLICPVKACGAPLGREPRALRCGAGHSFDVARSGYANLLQPQDRKSTNPGDTREAVAARRRLLSRGIGDGLAAAIGAMLAARGIGPGAVIMDAGCGEGFHLADACARLGAAGCGIDISTPAIDLAAKRYRKLTWIVANADRAIPLANGSVDAVLSITGRINRDEFARVLKPEGVALLAVAAADDLAELRDAVLGESTEKDRAQGAIESLAPRFRLEERARHAETLDLDHAALEDLLASTYRGQRRSQKDALAGVERMRVTSSRELLLLRAERK